MKFQDFENMSVIERRSFLKNIGLVLASPLIPAHIRVAANEILLSSSEAKAASLPTYFIEINLRDQIDLGHLFVPPSLANPNVPRGSGPTEFPLYDDPSSLRRAGNNFFIPREGTELIPHLDHLAVVDLCELPIGAIHGHEAANATRSPGRGYNSGGGRKEMMTFDPPPGTGGNETLFSSTPTPATLHNYAQRQISSQLRRGVVMKLQSTKHAVYHFAGHLADAQLDRLQSRDSIINAFKTNTQVPTMLGTHANKITELIKKIDQRFAQQMRIETSAINNHESQLQVVSSRFRGETSTKTTDMSLSFEEAGFWKQGVSHTGVNDGTKPALWEQCAYAYKLISNDMVRSIALEFCHDDLHGIRDENLMRAYGSQVGLPLARLIQKLKEASLFDRTVIAVYTTDGSRDFFTDSNGNAGKNTVIIAGGAVRGGYYGDVRRVGNRYLYLPPDTSGGLRSGTYGNDQRISGASIWKTVMKAAGVGNDVYNGFADVKAHPELNFLLRS